MKHEKPNITTTQTLNNGDIIRQEFWFKSNGFIGVHVHMLTSNEKLITPACFHRKFGNKHYISFESLILRSSLVEISKSKQCAQIIKQWMKFKNDYLNFKLIDKIKFFLRIL